MSLNRNELLVKREKLVKDRINFLKVTYELTSIGGGDEETFKCLVDVITKATNLIKQIDDLLKMDEIIQNLNRM